MTKSQEKKTENTNSLMKDVEFGVLRHGIKISVINKFKKLHDLMESPVQYQKPILFARRKIKKKL